MNDPGQGPLPRLRRRRTVSTITCGLVIAFVLCTSALAHADYIYTFTRTGTNSYSFSFKEPFLITTSMPNLNIGTIPAGGFTFKDSAVSVSGVFWCFAFGSGTTDATESTNSCGLQNGGAGISGVTAVFRNLNSVGTFNVVSGTSFSYPSSGHELTSVTIRAVPEPTSLILLATGAFLVVKRARIA